HKYHSHEEPLSLHGRSSDLAMDGALGRRLVQAVESKANFRILGWYENGFRHISNRVRTVRMPADLKGIAIRVLPSQIQKRTFELDRKSTRLNSSHAKTSSAV